MPVKITKLISSVFPKLKFEKKTSCKLEDVYKQLLLNLTIFCMSMYEYDVQWFIIIFNLIKAWKRISFSKYKIK